MEPRLLAFIGVAIVLTVTPGPDMALVARIVFGRGRVAGWRASLGVVSGHLMWGIASALGIAVVLSTSALLFTVLRLAGAAYLIWLGVRALVSRDVPAGAPGAPVAKREGSAYRQGIINNLLNPKAGVIYTTLLPQFIAPGQPPFFASIGLAAIFATIVALWLTIYVALLAWAGGFFRRGAVRRTMERLTGVVLIGLGLRLAVEQR
jgi:threonine/homoserine/homoserine lactone efflux protein